MPHDAAPWSLHSSSGSVPILVVPQTPSKPEPFLAALQAWQVPVQADPQHTPSTQYPLPQSLAARQVRPCAQRVEQLATGPPQSTPTSPPFWT